MTAAAAPERSEPHGGSDGLISRHEFRRLADLVLKCSGGQRTFFSLHDVESGTTRFANNEVVQHVQARRTTLAVTVAFGQQHATVTATDFGEETIREMVRSAERTARTVPIDPEYMPPLRPQDYPALPTTHEETMQAGPDRRVELAGDAIALCRAQRLTAAGIITNTLHVAGIAADNGLYAFEPRTEAKVSVTATLNAGSSGWAANVHRSIEQLGVLDRTRTAIQKARAAGEPRQLAPGHYTVILEPSAVAGLIGPVIWALDAKSYYKGTSAFLKKLGRPILDRRLTLRNVPDDPDLLGNGFNSEGLPAAHMIWIERGILKQLRYDRYTAQEHHVYPSPPFDAPQLVVDEGAPVVPGLDDLVRQTDRGILVSNFWYIRSVNPTDLTLTGMTRDGTFLIEDGRLTSRLVDFRWHDSPLRALAQVDAMTAPADAVSNEGWKMKLPTLKLSDFNFSSVSRL